MSGLFLVLMIVTLLATGVLLVWGTMRTQGGPLPPDMNRAVIILAAVIVLLAAASLVA
ncbi:cytochrome b subunit of formate dehydrogenase [Lipingzhangella halophila]|uniref:Cytochrome b subunit of formate dehydrogenase n=1 Tax=Lipingzhangella halophila TaxID=1783352 RepID=A0A7W7W2P8_9ACTN|nr:hypothetical protein [Lipingzhangella halophila]MBB4932172.1 cytochrome b subunit of formate dehydrogenase [Lipingzhangella halophila]